MRVYLETERMVLRHFAEADVDNLVALDSDPAVMRFLNGGKPTPRDVIQNETLPRFLSSYERYDGYGVWAAVAKSSGDFLGWFSRRTGPGRARSSSATGCANRPGARATAPKGRTLIRKGFAELGARRVVAQTMAVKLASRRVMEKTGLTLVRAFHQDWPDVIEGGEHGGVEYALLKADWERQEQEAAGRRSRNHPG